MTVLCIEQKCSNILPLVGHYGVTSDSYGPYVTFGGSDRNPLTLPYGLHYTLPYWASYLVIVE
jgi:hypothetical protein